MTARDILTAFLGAALLAGLLLFLSGASPTRSSFAGSVLVADAGTAASIPPPPPEAVTPGPAAGSARPSDGLADPVEDPLGAVQDARDTWPKGWALFGLAALIMLSRGLGTARRKWPASVALRWMAGKPALVVYGVGFVGAAAFDALVYGGTWFAVGVVAVGALLSLIAPDAKVNEAANRANLTAADRAMLRDGYEPPAAQGGV